MKNCKETKHVIFPSTADKISNSADAATGEASARSLKSRYHASENEDGITEDNEAENVDERLAHDSTPLLMKIAQRDDDDVHKFWSTKHNAGNGFYTGLSVR